MAGSTTQQPSKPPMGETTAPTPVVTNMTHSNTTNSTSPLPPVPAEPTRAWSNFVDAISQWLSKGDSTAVTPDSKLGLFQFTEEQLTKAGYFTPRTPGKGGANTWSGVFTWDGKIWKESEFLENSAIQHDAFNKLAGIYIQELKDAGVLKFDGTVVDGLSVTVSGLIAAMQVFGKGETLNCPPAPKLCYVTPEKLDAMGVTAFLESHGGFNAALKGLNVSTVLGNHNLGGFNVPQTIQDMLPGPVAIPPAAGQPTNPTLDPICAQQAANYRAGCSATRDKPAFTDRLGQVNLATATAPTSEGSRDKNIKAAIEGAKKQALQKELAAAMKVDAGAGESSGQSSVTASACSKCEYTVDNPKYHEGHNDEPRTITKKADPKACLRVEMRADGNFTTDQVAAATPVMQKYVDDATCADTVVSDANDAASHSFMIAGMVAVKMAAGQGAQALSDLKDTLVQTVRSAGVDTDAVANSARQGGLHGALRGASKVVGAKLGQTAATATYYGSYAMWRAMQAQNDGATAEEAASQAMMDTAQLAVVETASSATASACHAAADKIADVGWERTASWVRSAAALPQFLSLAHMAQNQGVATAAASMAASMAAGGAAEYAVTAAAGVR